MSAMGRFQTLQAERPVAYRMMPYGSFPNACFTIIGSNMKKDLSRPTAPLRNTARTPASG